MLCLEVVLAGRCTQAAALTATRGSQRRAGSDACHYAPLLPGPRPDLQELRARECPSAAIAVLCGRLYVPSPLPALPLVGHHSRCRRAFTAQPGSLASAGAAPAAGFWRWGGPQRYCARREWEPKGLKWRRQQTDSSGQRRRHSRRWRQL
jgi:hypothetical protein